MKKRILWILWLVMYGLCAGLAHISQRSGNQQWAIPALAALFFAPGGALLFEALRQGDQKTLRLLRWISAISVGLTVMLVLANVLSVFGSDTLGLVLHELLIFASVPMLCMGVWYVSLFLWCCIFFAALVGKRKKT